MLGLVAHIPFYAFLGLSEPLDVRRVLLVCHKNKWRDLSQKFVTSLFKTMFLFIEEGQENIFIGPKNIFDP